MVALLSTITIHHHLAAEDFPARLRGDVEELFAAKLPAVTDQQFNDRFRA